MNMISQLGQASMTTEEACALASQVDSDFEYLGDVTLRLAHGSYAPTADEMASLNWLYTRLGDIAQLVNYLRQSCSKETPVQMSAVNMDLAAKLQSAMAVIHSRIEIAWGTIALVLLGTGAVVGGLYFALKPSARALPPEQAAIKEAERAQRAAERARDAASAAKSRAESAARRADEKTASARTAKQQAEAEKARVAAEKAAVERARLDVRAAAERAAAAAARSEVPRAGAYAVPGVRD